ncbi:MAG: helix-hairpin-helix domain-containing protein [Prevotellaceae bacterium]|jgi:hypothetical protein|nr:helix-hairpin-helix domain-containing protein [Prevotellaceae bacterium]
MIQKEQAIKELMQIPGVGKIIAHNLWRIGIHSVDDLKSYTGEVLYNLHNIDCGTVQDRCVLYVMRCAVYFANTPKPLQKPELLKWWNWKNIENIDNF